MAGSLSTAAMIVPLFLPRLYGTQELLFVAFVFTAVLAILMGIHPEVFAGLGMLVLIMVMVDHLGANPMLAVMFILLASLIRLAGVGMHGLLEQVNDAGENALMLLVAIIDAIASRRDDD